MNPNKAVLLKIAMKVRQDFECQNIPKDKLCELYRAYNPEVDAESFVGNAEAMFPDLNCGVASAYLRDVFGAGDIINGSYDGHRHAFLRVDDVIVDITADQYGGPCVYVGACVEPWGV